MSSNIHILNAVLRQQIFLQRFAGGEAKQYSKAVTDVRRATKTRISKLKLDTLTKKQLIKLERDILSTANEIYSKANLRVVKNMEEFADYQAGFHQAILGNATNTTINTVSAQALNKAVFKTGLDLGPGGVIKLERALSQFSEKVGKNITKSIRQGIISGDSNREIRKALNKVTQSDSLFKANTLIRTITNHASSAAKTALYSANKDVIKEEKYVATLDVRTTFICAGLDGQRFEIGKGPIPPVHWNCRSVRTAIIKEEFDIIPQIKTSRASRDPKTGKTVRVVSGNTTYNSWLKQQPKSFQGEVLGEQRAKLFRDGGISIDKFTDNNFKTINLKKLKELEPLAFEKAKL